MKLTKYLLLTLIAFSFSQSGCKKGETAKTKKDYLTQTPWVLIKLQDRLTGTQNEWVDLTEDYNCSLDDTYTYKTDGIYIKEEGATKCSTGDQQTVTTNWTLSADGNTLNYGLGSLPVKQLDDNTLIVEYVAATPRATTVRRSIFGHR